MATNLSVGEREVEDLVHHGVKGMRWGVITKKAAVGKKKLKGKLAAQANEKNAKRALRAAKFGLQQRKTYKTMTDDELSKKVKRLEMEQRYRQLSADEATVRGRKVAREIMENSLSQAGTYVASTVMKEAFKQAKSGELQKRVKGLQRTAGRHAL